MRIAVVSDTHNRIPEGLLDAIADAEEIWHLGDVCDEYVLADFCALGRPIKVVRGNCDVCLDWPFTLDFTRSGHRIHLVHIPPRFPVEGADLVLHGHTHVPRNERIGATTFLNPGCLTRPNRGAPRSFAWLDLERGKPISWRLEVLV